MILTKSSFCKKIYSFHRKMAKYELRYLHYFRSLSFLADRHFGQKKQLVRNIL